MLNGMCVNVLQIVDADNCQLGAHLPAGQDKHHIVWRAISCSLNMPTCCHGYETQFGQFNLFGSIQPTADRLAQVYRLFRGEKAQTRNLARRRLSCLQANGLAIKNRCIKMTTWMYIIVVGNKSTLLRKSCSAYLTLLYMTVY